MKTVSNKNFNRLSLKDPPVAPIKDFGPMEIEGHFGFNICI
jgi:hypothetical protein